MSKKSKSPKGISPKHLSIPSRDSSADNKIDDIHSWVDVDQKSQEEFLLTSKWDSQMFEVKPSTPKENEFVLSEYFNEHIHERTKWLVLPAFYFIIIGTIIVTSCGLVALLNLWSCLFIIFALTWFGSLIGCLGVYRWGSVEGVLDFFQDQNNYYTKELANLGDLKKRVKQEAKNMHFSVGKLKNHASELEKNLKQFDNLRKELEKVCGDNKHLNEMLDELNKQYDDLQNLLFENEKAHLLSVYFECSFKDSQAGLTKKEYEQFCYRLSKKTRQEFENQGGFEYMDIDNNGKVDLDEFMKMLNTVLEIINEQNIKNLR